MIEIQIDNCISYLPRKYYFKKLNKQPEWRVGKVNVNSWNSFHMSCPTIWAFCMLFTTICILWVLDVQRGQSCDLCRLSSKSEACTTKQVNHTEDMFLLSAFNNLNNCNLAELSHDTITSLISQHRFSTSNHKRVYIKGKVFAGSDQLQTRTIYWLKNKIQAPTVTAAKCRKDSWQKMNRLIIISAWVDLTTITFVYSIKLSRIDVFLLPYYFSGNPCGDK